MCSPEKKADRDGMLFWLVWSEKCYSTQRRILRKVEMYPCIYIYIIKKRFRVPPFWVPAKVKVCFHVRVRLLKLVNLQHNKTQCQHFFIFLKVGFNWIFTRSPSFCFKSKLQSSYTLWGYLFIPHLSYFHFILGYKAIISFLPNLNINTDGRSKWRQSVKEGEGTEKITNQSAQ